MGKCLIIKGADFSQVAVTNVSDISKLKNEPLMGVIRSSDGEIVDSVYYCYTPEYYQNRYAIIIPAGYVVAVRLYNSDGTYVGTGGLSGMASGRLDLMQFGDYKIRFVFTVPENIGQGTVELTETDLQNILSDVTFE